MPGNEVGDRIHNYFGIESLSQDQHHSQVVDGTWPGLNNNLWVGNQRQFGGPLVSSSLKSYGVQPSADSERGHGGQSSIVPHGLNFTQSAPKSELVRSQSQNLQSTLNGYMHGHQALQMRRNESNFLGVDTEYDRHYLTSRGLQVLDSQLVNGPECDKKNSMLSESAEFSVNNYFFGGQQQMVGQRSSKLQSLPRQQLGIADMQQLHQEDMLKKLNELQRQQQLHNPQLLQQARQQSSINQGSSVAKQAADNLASGLINGIPMQDASNYLWEPELMANTNWLQRGASPVVQGSSGGLMFSPDQSQVRVMDFVSQQVDQSFYGVPISNSSSPIQMDKPTMQHISAGSNSFPCNQYAAFPDQVGMQDGTRASRQSYQGRNIFFSAAGQGSGGGLNLENLQQMNAQQISAPTEEYQERQGLVDSSEKLHERTVMQVTPSQNSATLDPEEEKILFGSDDNLWDAFGRSAMGSGLPTTLDSTEFLGALPSLQSGSWSALMQSAVAETSSGDIGVQGGWSGLDVRNIEPVAAAHPHTYVKDDSNKSAAWADNSLPAMSTMNSRPFPVPGDANTSANYSSDLGIQPSHKQNEKLQNDSSQRLVQQFSGERSKWLDHSPVQRPITEGSLFCGNVAHSSEAESHSKGISASWNHQEGLSLLNTSGQPHNRPNDWNFSQSVLPVADPSLKDQRNESSLQPAWSDEHKSLMHEQMGHGADVFMTNSVSSATEHANSTLSHQQVNWEDSNLNNDAAATSDSITIRANQKSSQQFPNSHNLDFWKNVDSSVNQRASEVPEKYQQHLDKSPQNIKSPGHDGSDNLGVECEMENSKTNEMSSDSHHSNTSHHKSDVWLNATDSLALPGEKQKSSGHIGRKPSGTRKFHYHPMGDVDMDAEPSYGVKSVAHSQVMLQHVSRGLTGHEQVYFGQSKFSGHSGKNSMENEKVHLLGFQGEMKYLDDMTSKGMNHGYAPLASAHFDESVGNYAPNRNAPSSQNMLELLHKVDQSKERSLMTNLSSSDFNQSQMHETEISDGSFDHLPQNQTSATEGFGLQLAPPSQRLSIADIALSSQSFSQADLRSKHVTSDMGKKGHTWLASSSSVQSLHPSNETSDGGTRHNISSTSEKISNKASAYNIQGNFPSGFPYSRSHLQNQQMTGAGGQVTPSQSVKHLGDSSERAQTSQAALASVPNIDKGAPLVEFTSAAETSKLGSNMQNHGGSSQQFPVLEAMPVHQPSVMPGTSQQGAFTKMSHDERASVSNKQSSSVSRVPPNLFKARLQSANSLERTFSGPEDDQISQKVDDGPSYFAAYSAKPQGFDQEDQSGKRQQVSSENDVGQKMMNASHLQGKESVSNGPNSTFSNSIIQRDIEAFGRSLKPNNVLHPNYSLLHQMQAKKSTETDPDNRSVKRFKGPDSSLDASQVVPVGFQQQFATNASAHVTPVISHNDLQGSTNGNGVGGRDENSQISPQMAPSWFDQYGTFKNEQMPSLYDARKITALKTMEQPFIVEKPSDSLHVSQPAQADTVADGRQLDNVLQSSIPLSVTSEHLSSPQSLPPITTDQNMVHTIQQKRKSALSEHLPWKRELMQGFAKLQNISMAEAEWAQATNRLMEKVEEESKLIEDGPLTLRSKRRLILTTQLMQQLLHHPQAKFLFSDASVHYESIIYFVARSALGDAVSSVSCSKRDASVHDSVNLLSENFKTSERIGHQYLSKAMEDFDNRAKKLEDDISRLNKRASIVDLRVEFQDLEKFSVINRFAKFHGRVQADGDANAKFFPQRYVTALPIPRNLPDRAKAGYDGSKS